MTPTAYPLQWPAGWPRTEPYKRERGAFRCTLAGALSNLHDQLRLLGAKGLVLSSNYTLGSSNPADPGVCAYFTHDGVSLAIPCDRWSRIEGNVQAVALTVEAMRGMNRWGAKHMIRAMFSGFKALPAPVNGARAWWAVLGCNRQAGKLVIQDLYRALAKERHPDAGGTTESFQELNEAFREFKKERGL